MIDIVERSNDYGYIVEYLHLTYIYIPGSKTQVTKN